MTPLCEPLCRFTERLYFTTFPAPAPAPHVLNGLATDKKVSPSIRSTTKTRACVNLDSDANYYYFTIDHQLTYWSFFEDWGPLNLAMVYKACILIHELLEDPELKSHRLVLYSSNDPRRKANAALLMALYAMIVERQAPWEAFHPIAELEFMPFRDAGRGHSDFNLSIQDCLWGIWKAMQNGLCDMNDFSVDDYEFYEKVENGDWNWITPSFIAFASPVEPGWMKKSAAEINGAPASPERGGSATVTDTALQRKLPQQFINCLDYFQQHNIKLVVRLNNMLYDKSHFLERGIRHLEMYFDDGTNPTDEIVRKFIDMADEVIEAGGVVAVHCKAGLGRTGTLIGAYLTWKYGFTAHEAIAFMRIVRPGSVVGPQQQYMYVKQLEWVKWAASDEIRKVQAASALAATTIVAPATPPADTDEDTEMKEFPMDVPRATTPVIIIPPIAPSLALPPVTPSKHVSAAAARARAISPPGQPRKTPVAKRTASAINDSDDEDELDVLPALNTNTRPSTRLAMARQVPGRTAGSVRTVPASDQRPSRITRSANGVLRKPPMKPTTRSAAQSAPTVPTTTIRGTNPAPNKIPRLANGPQTRSYTALGSRRRPSPASPTPSRLPTLIPTSRTNSTKSSTTTASDAWMKTNPSAVVKPGSKSERPGLRSVRRRRSSFSAADVVA